MNRLLTGIVGGFGVLLIICAVVATGPAFADDPPTYYTCVNGNNGGVTCGSGDCDDCDTTTCTTCDGDFPATCVCKTTNFGCPCSS